MESPKASFSPKKTSVSRCDPEEIEAIHSEVQNRYAELVSDTKVYLSPMAVSKLLLLLKKIRQSMDMFVSFPTRLQEERAHQLLNACKLVEHYCQPLIWYACGKYVLDTVMYTILCMESVINLCTTRHLQFRLKLYVTAFCAALAQNKCDEAENIYQRGVKEVKNLHEREHLDPPVPASTIEILERANEDLAVLKFVLDHFRDPDRLDLAQNCTPPHANLSQQVYAERCLCEYLRVHLLSSGNKNEVYMKRGHSIAKASHSYLLSLHQKQVNASIRCYGELSYFFLFDAYIDNEPRNQFFQHLRQLRSQFISQSAEDDEYIHKISLLDDVYAFSYEQVDFFAKENKTRVTSFLQNFEDSIYTNYSHRNPSLLIFLGMEVFKKSVFSPINLYIQQTGDKLPKDSQQLYTFVRVINAVLQCIDHVVYYDPVFYIALSLLLSNLNLQLEEYRSSISICKYALYLVDWVREVRVDLRLHLPEEIRDLISIQHMSITSTATLFDWYDSMKRLGAYAYAGFGIYGIYSSIHMHEEALQEMHLELYLVYYRSELKYYQHYLLQKDVHRKRIAAQQQQQQSLAGTVTTKPGNGCLLHAIVIVYRISSCTLQLLLRYCSSSRHNNQLCVFSAGQACRVMAHRSSATA